MVGFKIGAAPHPTHCHVVLPQGINVRNRAKELCTLLGNPDRIREERAKAKANKEKYKGLGRDAAAAGASGGMGELMAGLLMLRRQGCGVLPWILPA